MSKKSGVIAMGVGTALLLCGCVGASRPSGPAHLRGSVHGSTYTSAEGGFSVPFPVTTNAKVHGRILTDSAQSVTFIDDWGSRISFAGQAVLERSPMEAMLEKDGREKALGEFARQAYGDMITLHYHPKTRDGAISFIYLRPASPKSAVAAFLHGRRLFVVETDMLPGVPLIAQSDAKSQLDQELWLENRAVALAESMEVK
jgi:hypothetical protein